MRTHSWEVAPGAAPVALTGDAALYTKTLIVLRVKQVDFLPSVPPVPPGATLPLLQVCGPLGQSSPGPSPQVSTKYARLQVSSE